MHLVGADRVARESEPPRREGRARRQDPLGVDGASGVSVSIHTASAWPTRTGTRTHVALTGRSGSSRILRVSSRSFDLLVVLDSVELPVHPEPVVVGLLAAERVEAAEPAPETDWYVATRTRRRPAASCSGASTIESGIAQQLGFATMPACSSARSPLTSGTTSGMPGCRRNADDLSMHRAPAAAAAGTSSRLNCVPIEKKQTSRSPAPSASAVASSISSSPSEPPAERWTRTGGCSCTRDRGGIAASPARPLRSRPRSRSGASIRSSHSSV